MEYLLLIYAEEGDLPEMSGDLVAEYRAFNAELVEAGVHRGANRLHLAETATTVRVRDGQTLTSDGPFAETKEVLGGYFMIECENLDEARRWASKLPAARIGSVEIRPVM